MFKSPLQAPKEHSGDSSITYDRFQPSYKKEKVITKVTDHKPLNKEFPPPPPTDPEEEAKQVVEEIIKEHRG